MEKYYTRLNMSELKCIYCNTFLCKSKECLNKIDIKKSIVMKPFDISLINDKSFNDKLKKEDYLSILNILFSEYNVKTTNELINYIKMKNQQSILRKMGDNTVIKDKTVRNSLSLNFGSDVVNQLSKILLPVIINTVNEQDRNFYRFTSYEGDYIMEPSHGNLIYYEHGGIFKIHRDKTLDKSFLKEYGVDPDIYKMYTIILCIDSNLEERINSNEGNTVIYSPPFDVTPLIYNISPKDCKKYRLIPHIYNDSVIKGHFVIFPSNILHESIEIESQNKYKLVLKMDFWIQNFNEYLFFEEYKYVNEKTDCCSICNCKLCNPFLQKIDAFYRNILTIDCLKYFNYEETIYKHSINFTRNKLDYWSDDLVYDYKNNVGLWSLYIFKLEEEDYEEYDSKVVEKDYIIIHKSNSYKKIFKINYFKIIEQFLCYGNYDSFEDCVNDYYSQYEDEYDDYCNGDF